MQLIAGRTAQQCNQRKGRRGVFREDRSRAVIKADDDLYRCLVYIDPNMVRARVVNYPAGWEHSGYREIRYPPRNHTELSILRR